MKTKFQGYYRPTDEQFKTLWQSCIFAFDANVLLNLYTYSAQTRTAFLDILSGLVDRIWLPYQAATEYHRNRLGVIGRETKRYADLPGKVQAILDQLRSRGQHPFVSDKTLSSFERLAKQIERELDKGKKAHSDLYSNDPLFRQD